MSKRAREDHPEATTSDAEFVHLLCIDSVFQPVRADISLLKFYDCRTFKMIKNTAPLRYDADGTPVYYSWMTRSLLLFFLKSLTLGSLCVDAQTPYAEAVAAFDYEGITVPAAEDAAAYAKLTTTTSLLSSPPFGLAGLRQKGADALMEKTTSICETLASALLEWPRLEYGLTHVFSPDESATNSTNFECSTTRCWVQLCRPLDARSLWEGGADPTHALAKRRPFWLLQTLYALGTVHAKLVMIGKITDEDKTEGAFFELERAIQNDLLGPFLTARVDVPSCWKERAKEQLGTAELFAVNILSAVVEAGVLKAGDKVLSNVKYARATVALALEHASEAPKIDMIFGGNCEDADGVTPERNMLKNVLKKHNIKVVRWGNPLKPLVFLPIFRGYRLGSPGPCVLLEFI